MPSAMIGSIGQLPGQTATMAQGEQEPGEREPFDVSEGGLDCGEGSEWGGNGHRAPPERADTRAGPAAGPGD